MSQEFFRNKTCIFSSSASAINWYYTATFPNHQWDNMSSRETLQLAECDILWKKKFR
jgi:hypothetical protein